MKSKAFNKQIIIRVDCSKVIGMGHVMRCVTLAKMLKAKGARVLFVMRLLPNNSHEYVLANGFDIHLISTEGEWDVQQDAEKTIDIIKRNLLRFNWLIVDHYQLDARWELQMQSYVDQIMVIDDLANRPHECDLLLDQNIYDHQQERYQQLINKKTQLLLGPQFALLRDDFALRRQKMSERDGKIKRIFIFFGGGDYADIIIKTLRAIFLLTTKQFIYDVVVGKACSKQDEINKLCARLPEANFICQSDQMADLMANADLAIGAGGTTTWERCCLGLPTVVVSIADNQIAIARAVALFGAQQYLGHENEVNENQISASINRLLTDSSSLIKMSQQAKMLVDGLGCQKVARKLYE